MIGLLMVRMKTMNIEKKSLKNITIQSWCNVAGKYEIILRGMVFTRLPNVFDKPYSIILSEFLRV